MAITLAITLADAALAVLLAPVPLPAQQRNILVIRIICPGLPPDYADPVELVDLHLQAGPWHWLRAELYHSGRSQTLTAVSAEACTNGRPNLTDVEHVAEWPELELGEQEEAVINPEVLAPVT